MVKNLYPYLKPARGNLTLTLWFGQDENLSPWLTTTSTYDIVAIGAQAGSARPYKH